MNSRAHVDWSSRDLRSKSGAEQVVNELKKRSSARHLLLGQNALGDDGIELIMAFLCSPDGRRLPIEEISLNETQMSDGALDAVSRYLSGNQTLVGLHLLHVCTFQTCICNQLSRLGK
jgi:hypothetical protein